MKAKTLILPTLFVAIGIATYWFYSQSIISANRIDTKSNQPEAVVSTTTQENKEVKSSQDIQTKASDESLYELKSSIQDVIADSIQDEIQEAVENKIIKTDGVQQ